MKITNKRIIGILICMLLLMTIPLAAGMTVETETVETEPEPEEEPEGIFGITIIRGFVANVKQHGTDITFRAIRLHYLTISVMEKSICILHFE